MWESKYPGKGGYTSWYRKGEVFRNRGLNILEWGLSHHVTINVNIFTVEYVSENKVLVKYTKSHIMIV